MASTRQVTMANLKKDGVMVTRCNPCRDDDLARCNEEKICTDDFQERCSGDDQENCSDGGGQPKRCNEECRVVPTEKGRGLKHNRRTRCQERASRE